MAKKSMIKLNIVLTLVLSQWSLCGLLVQYCKPCHSISKTVSSEPQSSSPGIFHVYYNCVTYTRSNTAFQFCSHNILLIYMDCIGVIAVSCRPNSSNIRELKKSNRSLGVELLCQQQGLLSNQLFTNGSSILSKCYKCRVNNTVILRYTRAFAGKSQ